MSIETEITELEHTGPHIPTLQGEIIEGWGFHIGNFQVEISNTVFSTWIFMIILVIIVILFNKALKKNSSTLKSIGIWTISTIKKFSDEFIGEKDFSGKIVFLTGGLFLFVILANIFGLLLDWILLITNPDLHLANYLRPVNSDPNTTFAMSVSVVLLSHIVMIKTKGFGHYLKGYLFDFRGKGFEKIINLFVGWLHLISEFVKMLSLSLRLFGNIFAGIILISIMAFLGGMISIWGLGIGEFFVLPFWCFELFVAFIQAVVFFILPSVYFKQATELEH